MDKALKQRLVGASVLIILAVIVLPMLLSGRSDTLKQESRQIELPPKPAELSGETRRFPVGVPNQTSANTEQQSTEELPVPDPQDNPLTEAGQETVKVDSLPISINPDADEIEQTTQSVIEAATTETEKPPTVTSITLNSGKNPDVLEAPATDSNADGPRYLVQVASFSSEKNANALAGRLRSGNLPVVMDVVDRTAGSLHRVRVGPYVERADADAVLAMLRSEMKDLSPRILDLRPTESAPVSTPSDPLVRWVVQVGSFSSETSAEALVAKLRLSGLSAFSERVSSAGQTAFKVRIGPEIDRDKAADLARKVKTEHQLDAFVTTLE